MVSLFALVQNPIELESYIREGAALLQVSEEALYSELSRQRNKEKRMRDISGSAMPVLQPSAPSQPESPEHSAQLTLFALAVTSQENARELSDLLPPETLEDGGLLSQALNLLLAAAAAGESEADTALALNTLLADKNDSELGKILLDPPVFNDPGKALADSVAELVRITRRRRYTAITMEMRSCNDPERRLELMKQLQEVLKDR